MDQALSPQTCDGDCERCIEQPPDDVEFASADGVFIKQMLIAKSGTYIPQHAHKWDHTTLVAHGSVRVWADGRLVGDRTAPATIFILAGVKHTFLSLEDETVCYCVHRLHGTKHIEIVAEHQFAGVR